MGRPKLLLPLCDGLVIDRVLKAWTQSRVDETVVVVRKDDSELRAACQRWSVSVVSPEVDPFDMKASVMAGLNWLDRTRQPKDDDLCFIAPADVPTIHSGLMDHLIDEFESCYQQQGRSTPRLVVPQFGDRPGHPTLFRWSVTRQIASLGDNKGINQLVDRHRKHCVKFPASARVGDIDTPDEYQQLLDQGRVAATEPNRDEGNTAGRGDSAKDEPGSEIR